MRRALKIALTYWYLLMKNTLMTNTLDTVGSSLKNTFPFVLNILCVWGCHSLYEEVKE